MIRNPILKSINDQAEIWYTKWSETAGQIKWRVFNWLCWLFMASWFVIFAPFAFMDIGPDWMTKFITNERGVSSLLVYNHWVLSGEIATAMFIASILSIIPMKTFLWFQDVTNNLKRGLKFQKTEYPINHWT